MKASSLNSTSEHSAGIRRIVTMQVDITKISKRLDQDVQKCACNAAILMDISSMSAELRRNSK